MSHTMDSQIHTCTIGKALYYIRPIFADSIPVTNIHVYTSSIAFLSFFDLCQTSYEWCISGYLVAINLTRCFIDQCNLLLYLVFCGQKWRHL